MGAVFCFLLFLAAVGLCILLGQSLILAIWVGIAAFAALGLRRGMTVRAMWDAAWAQGRKMCCVIVIYMLIGAITALWRSAGQIYPKLRISSMTYAPLSTKSHNKFLYYIPFIRCFPVLREKEFYIIMAPLSHASKDVIPCRTGALPRRGRRRFPTPSPL